MRHVFAFLMCWVLLGTPTAFAGLMLPVGVRTDAIIHHQNYSLGYDEETEQAEWVTYEFTTEEANAPQVKRKNKFRSDPAVLSGSAALRDYKKSGFDRGHLAPAADMAFSRQSMDESFFMSNMSPQVPGFNRGVWKRLETRVRSWAKREDLVIVTGPILSGVKYIGQNHVLVPSYFYKIVYSPSRGKMIAFALPNKPSNLPLQHFILTVDEIEQITGIDFFVEMHDKFETDLEGNSSLYIEDWSYPPEQ